jgi:hypothetical protein
MIDGSLPGDYDENGVVDTADYVVWRNAMGVAPFKLANESASLGVVNQADYDVWKAHFGQSLPGSGGGSGSGVSHAVVPEPTCWIIALLALSAATLARRER